MMGQGRYRGRLLRGVKETYARLPSLWRYLRHPVSRPGMRRELLREIGARLGQGGAPRMIGSRVTETGSLVLFLAAEADRTPTMVAKIPFFSGARERVLHQYANLGQMAEMGFPETVVVPRPLLSFSLQLGGVLQDVALESHLDGEPAAKRLYGPGYERDLARAQRVWELLTRGKQYRRAAMSEVLPLVEELEQTLEVREIPCAEVVAGVRDALRTGPDPVIGPVHGDFWPGNLLFHGENAGIIDWDRFRPAGLPVLDLFHYLLYARAMRDHFSLARSWQLLMTEADDPCRAMLAPHAGAGLEPYGILYWLSFLSFGPPGLFGRERERYVERSLTLCREVLRNRRG